MHSDQYDKSIPEIESVLESWTVKDGPLDQVPRTPDGNPDVFQALVTLFDWAGQIPASNRYSTEFDAKGHLVLAGMFKVHCCAIVDSTRKVRFEDVKALGARQNYKMVCDNISSPELAKLFVDVSNRDSNASARNILTSESVLSPDGKDNKDGKDNNKNNNKQQYPRWMIKMQCAFLKFARLHELPNDGSEERCLVAPLYNPSARENLEHAQKTALQLVITAYRTPKEGIPNKTIYDPKVNRLPLSQQCFFSLEKYIVSAFAELDLHARDSQTRLFDLFCHALLVDIVRRFRSRFSPLATPNGRSEMRHVLRSYAYLGTAVAMLSAYHEHEWMHNALISTLSQNNPEFLTNLPFEVSEHLLTKTLIYATFKDFSPCAIHPPAHENETRKDYIRKNIPRAGQPVLFEQLHPLFDATCAPSWRSAVTTRSIWMLSHPQEHKLNALEHALPLIAQLGDQFGDQPGDQLVDDVDDAWKTLKGMQVGTRHTISYIRRCNRIVTSLMLVCKAFRDLFRDFAFHPHVELGTPDETAETVASSPALRGAVPRDVFLTTKALTLHLYFRRKTFKPDSHNGELRETWQYITPSACTLGCNAVRIRFESEPDETDGHVYTFDAAQPPPRVRSSAAAGNIESGSVGISPDAQIERSFFFSDTTPRDRRLASDVPHHLVAESELGTSLYSIHPGKAWFERYKNTCDELRLITVFDVKYDHALKRRGLPLALAQSLTLKAMCTTSSAQSSRVAKLLAMRARVEIGVVRRHETRFCHDKSDEIKRFPPDAKFVPCVSGTSPYFYSSKERLCKEAFLARTAKRHARYENELSEKRAKVV